MLRKLLLASLLLPLSALAQDTAVRYQSQVIGSRGVPLANQNVAVCSQPAVTTTQPCSPLATLATSTSTSSGGTNPFTTDSLGNFFFYATPGKYTVQIYGPQVGTPFVEPDTVLSCSPTGNCTITGTIISTGSLTSGSINSTKYLDGTQFPQTDAGLTSALTAAGANGTVVIPANAAVTVTTSHTISTNFTTVRCEPGAVLTAGATVSNGFFVLSGTGDRVLDCQFAPGSFPASVPIQTLNSSYAIVEGNTATGFTTGFTTFLALEGAAGTFVHKNRCVAGSGGSDCIFGENNTTDTLVSENYVDQSLGSASAHAIAFHSTTAGKTVRGSRVQNNTIVAGQNFCVEIGAFGGNTPVDYMITGNKCKLGANGSGGYSLGSLSQYFTISQNVFDVNGFTASIACVEGAQAADGSIVGNVCNGAAITMSNTQAQRVTVIGNEITGLPSGQFGIYIGTSLASGAMTDNVISGNIIIMPTAGAAKAIWLQCNATGATCNNNVISGNHILGSSIASSVGVLLEDDTGTMDSNLVGPNQISSVPTGVQIGAGSTNTKFYRGLTVSVTTPILDSGTSTLYEVERATTDTFTSKSTSAGPLTGVVASGTSTMASGAVAAATCAAAVTTTATGTATTDAIEWSYATAPTLTTDALLHISPYVTANNVNFTRCNPTNASITGTAIVINWRVVR